MFKICNTKMETLLVVETIEEARETILSLKKKGQYCWDIYECSELPTLWVETAEEIAEREAAHAAYLQKHGSFVELLEKRSAANAPHKWEDDE